MNNDCALIMRKMIQKELLKELEKINLIDFTCANNITKVLDGDINKLKELQDKDTKNIIINIPI